MENPLRINTNLVTIPRSAFFIEKVHRCADCPIRHMATRQPQSVFAKIHSWHKVWWPGWKAHQARACFLAANTGK